MKIKPIKFEGVQQITVRYEGEPRQGTKFGAYLSGFFFGISLTRQLNRMARKRGINIELIPTYGGDRKAQEPNE